jgi:hypothetical protein
VFRAKKGEMDWVAKRLELESATNCENVIKIRGLPYEATKADIFSFFEGKRTKDLFFMACFHEK